MKDDAINLIGGPCSGVSRYDDGQGYGAGGGHPSGARQKRGLTQYNGDGPRWEDPGDGSCRYKAESWKLFTDTDGSSPPKGPGSLSPEWDAAHAAALAGDLAQLPAGLGAEQGPEAEAVALDAVRELGLRTLIAVAQNTDTAT